MMLYKFLYFVFRYGMENKYDDDDDGDDHDDDDVKLF